MDPEQDTSARLASYFDGRGENFTALRHDSVHEIQKVAAAYRAYFTRKGQQADGGKDISHPGLYFLIDPEGQIRHTYSAAHRVAVLVVEDLKRLEGQS